MTAVTTVNYFTLVRSYHTALANRVEIFDLVHLITIRACVYAVHMCVIPTLWPVKVPERVSLIFE